MALEPDCFVNSFEILFEISNDLFVNWEWRKLFHDNSSPGNVAGSRFQLEYIFTSENRHLHIAPHRVFIRIIISLLIRICRLFYTKMSCKLLYYDLNQYYKIFCRYITCAPFWWSKHQTLYRLLHLTPIIRNNNM